MLVEGPAGIGKSRLLAEARRDAEEAGARRAVGGRAGSRATSRSASCASCSRPSWPIPRCAERALAGAGARPPVFAALDAPAADGAATFAALHGLYWVTLNLAAERPLALAVDDLHWCDVASLRAIAYLARRVEGQPVLVLTALRSGEPPTDATLVGEIVPTR